MGFEPTQLALVELESTPLDHSGKVSCLHSRHTAYMCLPLWLGGQTPLEAWGRGSEAPSGKSDSTRQKQFGNEGDEKHDTLLSRGYPCGDFLAIFQDSFS